MDKKSIQSPKDELRDGYTYHMTYLIMMLPIYLIGVYLLTYLYHDYVVAAIYGWTAVFAGKQLADAIKGR